MELTMGNNNYRPLFKILIALSVSFFAAFTVIYVSGVIAKKVTHSEYDETIQKFQAWMKAQDDKPIQP